MREASKTSNVRVAQKVIVSSFMGWVRCPFVMSWLCLNYLDVVVLSMKVTAVRHTDSNVLVATAS